MLLLNLSLILQHLLLGLERADLSLDLALVFVCLFTAAGHDERETVHGVGLAFFFFEVFRLVGGSGAGATTGPAGPADNLDGRRGGAVAGGGGAAGTGVGVGMASMGAGATFGLVASMFGLVTAVLGFVAAVLGFVAAILGLVAAVLGLVAAVLGSTSCGTAHYVPFADRAWNVGWLRGIDDDFRCMTLHNLRIGRRRRGSGRFNHISFLDWSL